MPAMQLIDHRWMSECVCCRGWDNCQINDTSAIFMGLFFFGREFSATLGINIPLQLTHTCRKPKKG